jgi:hypothetical protein
MADIPSFASKSDFYGILLPGYLIDIVYLVFFQSNLLSAQEAPSFDLLSAVIFLVAGPVTGLILQQTHRIVIDDIILAHLSWKSNGTNRIQKFEEANFDWQYYVARINATDNERNELDLQEAEYDFDVSCAIGLMVLGLANLLYHERTESSVWFLFATCVAAVLLGVGAYYSRKGYGDIVWELISKYNDRSRKKIHTPRSRRTNTKKAEMAHRRAVGET